MLDSIYAIEFEGNRVDLVPGVNLYNHSLDNLPDRDIKINKLARRSLSIITSSEWTQKNIPVWLDICSGTRSDTEATVTYVKSLLQGQNGTLLGLQGGIEVAYTCTLNEFSIEWDNMNAYCSLVFLASTPIGTASVSQNLATISGNTTQSTSATFIVAGSADAEPLIDVVLNSVTGGTGASVSVSNARTDQGITITADFVSGDIIEIDSANLVVTLNGGNVDFTGLFPTFPPGSQQISYSDSFTARSIDLTATYKQRLI